MILTYLNCFFSSIFKLKRILLSLVGLVFISAYTSTAQVALMGGLNYANERNNNLLENQKPIVAYHFGASIRYYPFKKRSNISLQNELIFNQKGYKQVLDKEYVFHFNYISLPILINYAPTENFSINAGFEFSRLLSGNIRRSSETYNYFDIGLVSGFSCFDKQRISFYSKVTYGLLPMLDYYTIDKMGNFTGKIHDLINICLSVGIKINIYNEKIQFIK